jgi:hypothetical protein
MKLEFHHINFISEDMDDLHLFLALQYQQNLMQVKFQNAPVALKT